MRFYTLILLGLLTACGGGQTQYYHLPRVAGEQVAKVSQKRFALRHFNAPSYLQEKKIMRKQGVEVIQSALGRWQDAPAVLFKQQLFNELQTQLPSAWVEQYPLRDDAKKPDFIFDVRISEALADDKNLYFTASYAINPDKPPHHFERIYPLQDGSDAALVAAHQSALHDLALAMVAAVK